MYEFLKMLQPVAEQVGKIREVRVTEKGNYTDDRVVICGATDDGKKFELELTIEDGEADA